MVLKYVCLLTCLLPVCGHEARSRLNLHCHHALLLTSLLQSGLANHSAVLQLEARSTLNSHCHLTPSWTGKPAEYSCKRKMISHRYVFDTLLYYVQSAEYSCKRKAISHRDMCDTVLCYVRLCICLATISHFAHHSVHIQLGEY